MIESSKLASFLTARFGLGVLAERIHSSDGQLYRIRPEGIPTTIGFTLDFLVGWRSVNAQFIPGNFAAGLVQAMENANPDQVAVFTVFVKTATEQGAELRMQINDLPTHIRTPELWPKKWRSVRFEFRKGALVLDPNDNAAYEHLIFPWAARFFGTILSLLPVEPIGQTTPTTGEEEGRPIEARAKRYERSHINRAACIELHGLSCKVCGMVFTERYGAVGDDFIHVHHLEPLSMMDGPYIIDPATDLVPVCPNCHAMLHKKTPPLKIDELNRMLNHAKQA